MSPRKTNAAVSHPVTKAAENMDAAQHKVIQTGPVNKLDAYLAGEQLQRREQRLGRYGNFSQFWRVMLQGTQLAQTGVTGSDIGRYLCSKGILDYWFQGKLFAAGTPTPDQPSVDVLRDANPRWEAVEGKDIPTRAEFFNMIRKDREAAATAQDEEANDR